ncbi:hypothetical protein, partial [Kitasatospora paracochleata]|uniref:hypothetical protein n=1 Tax=Kitasatospora paracochleata TaxID=58354 RepID=UPI0031CF7541
MNEETFSELLREVRERAGGPALAKLAKLGAASDSTLQLLLAGQFKKAPDLDLVLNFIAACKTFAAQKKRSLPAGCADEKLWRERHLQLTAVLEDRDRQARKATTLAGGSYVLSAWPTGAARTTDGPARPTSPSALLAEASSRVPFTGREAAYQRLVAWRDEPRASPASVRLLVGPGGQGKTRLAAHFAERSTPASWTVWRARPQRLGVRTSVPARPGPQGKKALVIVDYADRWPYEYLEEMLEGLVQGRRTQLRVLLIARSDAFWHSRVHDFRSWGYTAGPPDILEGLPRGSADRALMYAAAHSAYARALGAEPAAASPSRAQLDGEAFELVLSIHMVALAAVYGHPTQHQDSLDPAELSGFLLDRERNYWQKLRDAGVITTDITTMEQATVVATLVQGLGYDDALDVLQATRVAESPGAARDILRDHALAYPPDDELTELTPLRPDRLGEDLLGQSVPSHAGRRRGQPWAALLYARLLARSPQDPPAPAPGRDPAPAAPAWTRASLEVLTAAALRWPHLTTTQIAPLLTADPAIMRHASSTTLSNLTGLADLQPSTLLAVEAALPFGDLELEPGAAELAAHLRPHLLAAAADPAGRGTVHRRIALRMTGAGRHEDALDDMQALAAILRTGRAEDPTSQALAHGLARALDSIGYHQHHLGRYADAAETTREAVEIFSSLAPSDTLIEDPGLVRALANLAGRRRAPPGRLE